MVPQTTGGRYSQRPTVWKLGSGKVPIDEIPKDIRLLRHRQRVVPAKRGYQLGFPVVPQTRTINPKQPEKILLDVKKEPQDANRATKTSKTNPAGSEIPATPIEPKSKDNQLKADGTNSTKSEAENLSAQDKPAGTLPQNNGDKKDIKKRIRYREQ